MASETGLLLRQGIQYPVAFRVDLVTGCTAKVFTLMHASEPAQAPPGLMTAQAYLILISCRGLGGVAEGDRRKTVLTPALCTCMFLAGAMAGFALEIRKWCALIGP
jgi:hypothetical protein